MTLASFLPLVIGAIGIGALVQFILGWVETPDSLPQRLRATYVLFYQEHTEYLLDRTPVQRFALFHAGSVLLGLAAGYFFYGTALVGLLGGAVGMVAPALLLRQRRQTRRDKLQQQVDPALQFLASTLAVNPNVENALHLVSVHFQPPISEELARVVSAYRLGQRLDDALKTLSERCQDPYVTALVVALLVGRRTGGDIAETLRRIAYSTRESVRIEQDLRSKTRGQQNQFYLVVVLYVLALVALKLTLPESWQQLTTTDTGKLTLIASVAVVGAAIAWAQRILSPKNL
jgi:tight adherence protein B